MNFRQNLVDIFTNGLTVDNWAWEDYDKDYHCLWESERHEVDVQLAQMLHTRLHLLRHATACLWVALSPMP